MTIQYGFILYGSTNLISEILRKYEYMFKYVIPLYNQIRRESATIGRWDNGFSTLAPWIARAFIKDQRELRRAQLNSERDDRKQIKG